MRDLTDVATAEKLGRRHRPAVAARELHARRQDLLRADQHPLLAVAVAVEQGLRGRRHAGPDQLGRVRRRRARRCARPARSRSPSAASPGSDRRLQRHDDRPRRQGPLRLKVYGDKDAEVAAGPEMAKIFKAADDAREMSRGLERPGLEPGDQHGHHRPGRRPDHGRLGAGRVPGRGRGRRHRLHLPAGPRRQRDHLDRRRRLLLPAARRRGEVDGAGGARLDDVQRRRRRSPSTSRRARCRSAATSTSRPPTTA